MNTSRRIEWLVVLFALALALVGSVSMWWIDEWNQYSYFAGIGTGAMIATVGMMADDYKKRSGPG